MKVLVDADACPVKNIIEEVAHEFELPVIMIIDTSHELYSDYSQIVQVSKAPDAVDVALFNRTQKWDIVVTNDYGVASMDLGKRAFAINHNGKWFTDNNIDTLMYERHIAAKQRKAGVHSCSIRKRTKEDDNRFRDGFTRLCAHAIKKQSGAVNK